MKKFGILTGIDNGVDKSWVKLNVLDAFQKEECLRLVQDIFYLKRRNMNHFDPEMRENEEFLKTMCFFLFHDMNQTQLLDKTSQKSK